MPWCPKCKQEYVEGIVTCADCKTDLVENLTEDTERITFLETEKELFAKKFSEFLEYSKIVNVEYHYEETLKNWIIVIDEKDKKQVDKLYKAFYSVEADSVLSTKDTTSEVPTFHTTQDEMNEADISKDAEDYQEIPEYRSMFEEEELQDYLDSKNPKPKVSATYVKKEEQYKDLKSSADTFLIVSLVGIVVLILNIVGILNFFAGTISYLVMSGLFIAFLVIAFATYKKAKEVKTQIAGENDTTKAINEWLFSNITLEYLDSLVNPNESKEIQFFHKIEKIKELVERNFGELDDSYLDQLAEEFYNTHLDISEV
ncbi:hypothetical protein acsn021_25700 [Anaerocolumna cellulosilytica]|uniref:Uncharacterized protein n=1 Tax=Anaerocolumna cellulosilytica TaxID=433286 RepID=A0A6S6R7R7_9FIRM|nr:hypothetical protein [Anaerocolumna cellulosilytica]MBB5193782.1 thiol-disulfide isomerase/thioredoxin [Anaerocolumna cellulosilytica]BCJ95001.1 hypothetical protein acsn021_25700 [Anaerocolumna cellulosilytica]